MYSRLEGREIEEAGKSRGVETSSRIQSNIITKEEGGEGEEAEEVEE